MKKYDINDLLNIMAMLRSDQGCSWDKKQNHDSLKKYNLEEVYELIHAIDEKDDVNLKEELGDVLLQIVFHAQIAKERAAFDFDTVVNELVEKLLRRHPHIFKIDNEANFSLLEESSKVALSSEDVEKQWQAIKSKENKNTKKCKSIETLNHLPALIRAQKISKQAAKLGFDWSDIKSVWDKVEEEILEFKQADNVSDKEEEMGDILFALMSVCRFEKIDAEVSLSRTIEKFLRRFAFIESKLEESKQNVSNSNMRDLEKFWQMAKDHER